MKKQVYKFAIMTTASMMMITGCGNNKKSEITVNNENSVQTVAETKAYDDSIISMWLDEKGSYKVIFDENSSDMDGIFEYNFQIPQINDDTEGAKAINEEIQQICADLKTAMNDIKDDGILSKENFLEYGEIKYKTIWNGSVVSIVITCDTYYDYSERYAFCYDAEKGKKLTNEEIFKLGGISEEEWLNGMVKTVADASDKELEAYLLFDVKDNSALDEAMERYRTILGMRVANIDRDHVNAQVPVYLDSNGEVVGIMTIEGIAGGGINYMELKPQKSFEGKNFTASMDDMIKVKCDNGKITLTIEDCEWSRCNYLYDEFKFGVPYEVGGVTKDYVDCAFISLNDNTMSIPVFLSDDGMVSYIDLAQGTKCGYLCMTEPLMGIVGLKDLESHTDEIKTVLEKVLSKRNNYFDSCLMGISNYEWLETEVQHKTDGGGSYLSIYTMGYATEEENYKFIIDDSMPDVGLYSNFEGICKYMGMVPDGKIFSYEISDGACDYRGTFLLNVHGNWDDLKGYYRLWAEYKYLGGTDFFDSCGNELYFEKSQSVG